MAFLGSAPRRARLPGKHLFDPRNGMRRRSNRVPSQPVLEIAHEHHRVAWPQSRGLEFTPLDGARNGPSPDAVALRDPADAERRSLHNEDFGGNPRRARPR